MASKNFVCVSNGTDIKRIRRKEADRYLATGWSFAKRAQWKKEVRDQKGYVAPVQEVQAKKEKKEKKNKQKEKLADAAAK